MTMNQLNHLRVASTQELEEELERRASAAVAWEEADDLDTALITALRAAAVCIETGVNGGPIDRGQARAAADLVFKLTYRCLPGGGHDPTNGLQAGWVSQGAPSAPEGSSAIDRTTDDWAEEFVYSVLKEHKQEWKKRFES